MSRFMGALLLIPLWIALGAGADDIDPSPDKALVPDNAAAEEARKSVKRLFRTQYAALKDRIGRAAFAKQLLETARESKDGPAVRYVLLAEAADLASQASEIAVAWQAIEETARGYHVDGLELKQKALKAASRPASPESIRKELAPRYVMLIDEATKLGNYRAAEQAAADALQAGRKSGAPCLVDQLEARYDQAREVSAAHDAMQEAREPLLARGRFTCLLKGDWEAGLPVLARADDDLFAPVARLDLARPGEPKAQEALADAWLLLAKKEKGTARQSILDRAVYWYEQARRRLKGLEKREVAEKLQGIFGPTAVWETTGEARGVSLGGEDLNPRAEFTAELWVSTTEANGILLTKRHIPNDSSLTLALADGRPVLISDAPFDRRDGGANDRIDDGMWHHVAMVKTGKEAYLYLDGQLAASASSRETFDSTSPWKLGFHETWQVGKVTATFCRIRFSNAARYYVPFPPTRDYGRDTHTLLLR